MPLIEGYSRRSIAQNIATCIREGKPREQAIAIAMDIARRARRKARTRRLRKRARRSRR